MPRRSAGGFPTSAPWWRRFRPLTTEKAVKLFEEFSVFTRAELESRAEVEYENYSKAVNIEARTMIDMASKQIIPAVIKLHHAAGELHLRCEERLPGCGRERADRAAPGVLRPVKRHEGGPVRVDGRCGEGPGHGRRQGAGGSLPQRGGARQ